MKGYDSKGQIDFSSLFRAGWTEGSIGLNRGRRCGLRSNQAALLNCPREISNNANAQTGLGALSIDIGTDGRTFIIRDLLFF